MKEANQTGSGKTAAVATRSQTRVLNALSHVEGPVPIDFGGGPTSGIHCSVVEGLRGYFGLERKPVTIIDPFQMLGYIDDDLKDALGADTEPFWNPYTLFGFPCEGWKEWRCPWGQTVLVPAAFQTDREPGGSLVIYPAGDRSVPPSGRMPESGYFFDSIIRQGEIDEDALNPEDNLEEFGPADEYTLDFYKRRMEELAGCGRFILANFGGTALGDIALVPAPGLRHPRGIRDVSEWYISTVSRQDYIHEVFSRQTEIAIENLRRTYETVGDFPGCAYVCGTDFGTQQSTFCSPETFDSLYAPYYKKINAWIHEHTPWKTFKHSCGAVSPLMERFIEAGFDIINPVQLSAAGMDGRDLKRRFGGRLVFWGAGVDTQRTLPFGTPKEVVSEVTERLRMFAPGGGFVFNTIHNIQAKTPVENVAAMVRAVKDFNGER